MPVIHDESLQDHARTIRSSYDARAEALRELSEEQVVTRGLPAEPGDLLPDDVLDASNEYEEALGVRLRFLKYTRTRNGELEDAIDTGEPLPEDPVQLTRAVTVSSTQGAVVILEQWLAEAVPADDAGEEG
ncbi:MAG: hypothetical protein MAG451_00123 [Anaerolineales bacterium]|nr:hypothetical protein [Anaerolineales bacterium]